MVAEDIQSILEGYDDIEVIAALACGQAIIDRIGELAPDLILPDLNMPGIGELSTTEMLLERRPGTRILIRSVHDSPEYIASAFSQGAQGYVLKDVPLDESKRAIDAVMAGQRYLCTGVQGSLAPFTAPEREKLTNREQTILLMFAQGKADKDPAVALDISVRTAETHRKTIKRKLGIASTTGLTRYALEHGVW